MRHIVYKTTNTINGKFYIGVHEQDGVEFDGYLGSGSTITDAINKYGRSNFVRETLFDGLSESDAYDIEWLLVCGKLIRRKDCYNEKEGGCGGYSGLPYRNELTGEIKSFADHPGCPWVINSKDMLFVTELASGNRTKIHRSQFDTQLYELSNNRSFVAEDEGGVRKRMTCDDPLVLDGTYKFCRTGMHNYIINGEMFDLPTNDPRVLSGEAKSIFDGFMTVVEISTGRNVRIHKNDFDKTKYVSIVKGRVRVTDMHGNISVVRVDNPRYISGELTFVLKGVSSYVDSNGVRYSCVKGDPRIKELGLKSITTGTVSVVDIDGNTMRVPVDDPRILSGELVSTNKNRKCITDGINNKKIPSNLEIPDGWRRGRVTIRKQ